MHRKNSLLVCLLVIMTFIVGCGNNGKESASNSATPSSNFPMINESEPTMALPVIGHIPVGRGIDIMYIRMTDESHGWGIGGLDQHKDHVFVTRDGGKTWRDVTPPQVQASEGGEYPIIGTFLDEMNGWVVFNSSQDSTVDHISLWRTQDAGVSWKEAVISSQSSSEQFNSKLVEFIDELHGWLLVQLGAGMNHEYVELLGTADGGATWETLVAPGEGGDIQGCRKIQMVFYDVLNGWLAQECSGLFPAPGILHTTDGGSTWSRVVVTLPANAQDLFETHTCELATPKSFTASSLMAALSCWKNEAPDSRIVYISTSDDGGATWNSSPLPVGYSMGQGFLFFDPNNGFALGKKIYRTTDGGKKWNFVQEVFWDGEFSFVDNNLGWASVMDENQDHGLVRTANGGVKWEMLNPMVVP